MLSFTHAKYIRGIFIILPNARPAFSLFFFSFFLILFPSAFPASQVVGQTIPVLPFCGLLFWCFFQFTNSHLISLRAARWPVLLTQGLLGSCCGDVFPRAGSGIFISSLCYLCSSKQGQGEARTLLRRGLGWNCTQMSFDKCWKEDLAERSGVLICWEPLASACVHAFSFCFLPLPPEPWRTCCCSHASCQQWHLLSVAIKNLNVNILALKWMEKYLSLSGNHSSNKRLARQGP